MMKNSQEINGEIAELQGKLAPLQKQIEDMRAASEAAEAERQSYAFASLVERNAESTAKMDELNSKAQRSRDESQNLESALRVGNEKLSALRSELQCALLREKIEECRSLCEDARVDEKQLEKLVAPLLKVVKKAQDAEDKLRTALLELGEIVRPRKVRAAFEAQLYIENRSRDLGSPASFLAVHVLGKDDVLKGYECGREAQSMLDYRVGMLDEIEKELSKLLPKSPQQSQAA